MIQHTIYDNTIDNWLPFEAFKPIIKFLPKPNATTLAGVDYDFVVGLSNLLQPYKIDSNHSELRSLIATLAQTASLTSDKLAVLNASSAFTNEAWLSAFETIIEANINAEFADFNLVDLASTSIVNFVEFNSSPLFESVDTNKLINIVKGVQAVRIPPSKLNEKHGKYYISISPKYIETTITNVFGHYSNVVSTVSDSSTANITKNSFLNIGVSNQPFLEDQLWKFNYHPSSSVSLQAGRLQTSIVEIYSGGVLKTTKNIVSDFLNLGQIATIQGLSVNEGLLSLAPSYFGWDSYAESLIIGDVIRIYPKESYFKPIVIELTFKKQNTDIESLLAFLQNDVVRDTITGVFDIYDQNGVTINGSGEVEGNIIQSYQIQNLGRSEVRKRITIQNQNIGSGLNDNTTGLT